MKSLVTRTLAASAVLAILGLMAPPAVSTVSAQTRVSEQPYVIDYYYKVKWGYAAEWLRLFKKNHYPVLKKDIADGRIVSVTVAAPRYHSTEEGRWDYRVTITFKNVVTAHDANPDQAAVLKQLYPDQATFEKEEQRRFEILEAHWDVPMTPVDVDR